MSPAVESGLELRLYIKHSLRLCMMNGMKMVATVFARSRDGNGPRFGDDGFSATCMGFWALLMRTWYLLPAFVLQGAVFGHRKDILAVRCGGDREASAAIAHGLPR